MYSTLFIVKTNTNTSLKKTEVRKYQNKLTMHQE